MELPPLPPEATEEGPVSCDLLCMVYNVLYLIGRKKEVARER